MKINYAVRVDNGTKETNDDRVLVNGDILDIGFCNGEIETPAIAVVCDGCGGYSGGAIAAHTVLELLSYETPMSLSNPSYLQRVLEKCQRAVLEKKVEIPQFSKMCTTIAGCVFGNDSSIFFHSGDSRIYRFNNWGLARMTKDHSVVQEMVDMGYITPEEALKHPKRNIISRCIGIEGHPPEIYISCSPILPGEKFLICSDGLWECVRDSEIEKFLSKGLPLQTIVDQLTQKALKQGADDNISICICAAQGGANVQETVSFTLD